MQYRYFFQSIQTGYLRGFVQSRRLRNVSGQKDGKGLLFYLSVEPPALWLSCRSKKGNKKSTRRDSNPRPSPWQGDTPPLSHSRIEDIPSKQHTDIRLLQDFYYTKEVISKTSFSRCVCYANFHPALLTVSASKLAPPVSPAVCLFSPLLVKLPTD